MNIQVIPYCKKSKAKKNGEAPIYLVLRINSVDKLISTYKYIHCDFFSNEKEKVLPGHQNSIALNSYIINEKAKIEKIILELQNEKKLITHATVINKYKGENPDSFIRFAREELKLEVGIKAPPTIEQHTNSINNLEKYDPFVTISEIDAAYLKRYRAYLAGKGRAKNGYAHDLVSIRKFINIALKSSLIKTNPFEDFKIELEETEKAWISDNEKEALLKALPLLPAKLYHTLLYFLIACETSLRYQDMLLISQAWVKGNLSKYLSNNNIFLVQHKGKKPNRIPCTDLALYLFSLPVDRPLKIKKNRITNDLKEIMAIAKINKAITFHCARHTFAILALEKGVHIKAISQVMGHSTVTTTEIYAKYVDTGLDNEMAKLNG